MKSGRVTPSSLFLQREIHTRFDLLQPDSEVHVGAKQTQQKFDHDLRARGREFSVGDLAVGNGQRNGDTRDVQ